MRPVLWSNMGSMFVGTDLGLKWDLCSNMGSMFVRTDLGLQGDLVELKSEMSSDAFL